MDAMSPDHPLVSAIPIIPSQDLAATVAWYRDKLGFEIVNQDDGYGIVGRDDVFIHFWGPSRIAPHESNTMIRLGVVGIDEWYQHCLTLGIVHHNAPLAVKPWGSTEFAVLDVDGNLVTFFEFKDVEEANAE
jgi:catechol 2,3-dioxygenase-like lactoylglutathione lyase family enzyme